MIGVCMDVPGPHLDPSRFDPEIAALVNEFESRIQRGVEKAVRPISLERQRFFDHLAKILDESESLPSPTPTTKYPQ